MAFSPQQVHAAAALTSATTTTVVASDSVFKQKITKVLCTEQTGAGNTITLWLVTSGGSTANSNRVVNAEAIAASASHVVDSMTGKIIPTGSTLVAQAGSGTTDLIITVDVVKFSDPS